MTNGKDHPTEVEPSPQGLYSEEAHLVFESLAVFENRKCLHVAGWQKLRERGSGAPRKVRVFYERKDLQHTLFCRET